MEWPRFQAQDISSFCILLRNLQEFCALRICFGRDWNPVFRAWAWSVWCSIFFIFEEMVQHLHFVICLVGCSDLLSQGSANRQHQITFIQGPKKPRLSAFLTSQNCSGVKAARVPRCALWDMWHLFRCARGQICFQDN